MQCIERPAQIRASAQRPRAATALAQRKGCCSGSRPNCTTNCVNSPSTMAPVFKPLVWKRWKGCLRNVSGRSRPVVVSGVLVLEKGSRQVELVDQLAPDRDADRALVGRTWTDHRGRDENS